jgi:hypothetical protein
MIDVPLVRAFALTFPGFFTGRALHQAALRAAQSGDAGTADALYERAAARYRIDLEVEALARLRIHQLVTRARGSREAGQEAELLLEAAQRLSRLDQIESFDPPFGMIPASGLFESGTRRMHGGEAADPVAARKAA